VGGTSATAQRREASGEVVGAEDEDEGGEEPALESAEAVRAGEARVKEVAGRLYDNCKSCHRIFRE
jgi:hypothetical protein